MDNIGDIIKKMKAQKVAMFTDKGLRSLGLVKESDIPDTSDQDEPKPFGVGACAIGGEAAFSYVAKVIELAMAGEIDATVTNALSKNV